MTGPSCVTPLMVGATLFTARVNVAAAVAPSLSAAVIVTVRLAAGPSAAARDQVQVPSGCTVTAPAEADSVTTSLPASDHVPAFVAVCPSFTVTVARSTTAAGATLSTMTANALDRYAPSSSAAVAVIV